MKFLVSLAFLLAASFSSAQISNVSLRIDDAFDAKNPFVACVVHAAIAKLEPTFRLYAYMDATPVGEKTPADFANLRFAIIDTETENKDIYKVYLKSLDTDKKWQIVNGDLFSTSISEKAQIFNSSSEFMNELDLTLCR